jgi:hypothetical protein
LDRGLGWALKARIPQSIHSAGIATPTQPHLEPVCSQQFPFAAVSEQQWDFPLGAISGNPTGLKIMEKCLHQIHLQFAVPLNLSLILCQ